MQARAQHVMSANAQTALTTLSNPVVASQTQVLARVTFRPLTSWNWQPLDHSFAFCDVKSRAKSWQQKIACSEHFAPKAKATYGRRMAIVVHDVEMRDGRVALGFARLRFELFQRASARVRVHTEHLHRPIHGVCRKRDRAVAKLTFKKS